MLNPNYKIIKRFFHSRGIEVVVILLFAFFEVGCRLGWLWFGVFALEMLQYLVLLSQLLICIFRHFRWYGTKASVLLQFLQSLVVSCEFVQWELHDLFVNFVADFVMNLQCSCYFDSFYGMFCFSPDHFGKHHGIIQANQKEDHSKRFSDCCIQASKPRDWSFKSYETISSNLLWKFKCQMSWNLIGFLSCALLVAG